MNVEEKGEKQTPREKRKSVVLCMYVGGTLSKRGREREKWESNWELKPKKMSPSRM